MSLTVTDLFCGAGGSSIGAELSGATLRLGLNHWQRAIETHATNFQHADHDCEDVSSLTTSQIRRYPDSDILLASPECTNHSLAKGSRRRKPQAASLFEDGPAGDDEQDRSRATMWDVIRFAEQKLLKGKPYRVIIVENVVDAFNWGYGDDGGLFDAWLLAMRALGYEHETVWLNSMFAGAVPQSRDRMYVVFWQKGIRAPNLRFEPTSWCPACEAIVDGRQMFKRQRRGRNWGRYGPQYLFRCPGCASTVLPGAFPAARAIDWALPAQLIGERDRPLAEATRERIRRGLERLANEPFAIRLTHGGNPRPLTLPLVTLTRRHDVAMVMPVAGNTFERTPGNRARDADRQPLDTVHATLDRAVVLSGTQNDIGRDVETDPLQVQVCNRAPRIVMRTGHASANGHLTRDADIEPALTQTTQDEAALVLSNRANNVPRVAAAEPSHPVLTGEHLGVVIRNNKARGNPGQMATPTHEPIRTLTAYGGRQALLIPYRRAEPKVVDQEPAPTLHTRDPLAIVVPAGGTWADRSTIPGEEPLPTQTATEARGIAELVDADIDDCRFRMFELHEIAEAMAMRDHVDGSEYVVLGNKRERMAQYGNAVTPPAMRALVDRCVEVLA